MRLVHVPEGASLLTSVRALEGVAWVRAVGRLSEAELRAADGRAVSLRGDLTLVSLEGASGGALYALVSQTDALGARLVAGELTSATVAAPMDVCVLEPRAALDAAGPAARAAQTPPAPAPSEPSFARAIEASAAAQPLRLAGPPGLQRPARPVKPDVEEDEQPVPDAGDRVEHFAFGPCEVVKSDGERLHLKLGKNGSIKEIALEMLRVSLLPEDGAAGRRFKLERRL